MPRALSRSRLASLLEAATSKRIAIIGDAMLDVYLRGDVERISPEAPVPVVRVREKTFAPGGAANVAHNVAAIGAECELVGCAGADAAAGTLREILHAQRVMVRGLVESRHRATTTKTRVLARVQQVVRIDEEDDSELEARDGDEVTAAARVAIGEADALVLEDYNKGVLSPAIIQIAIGAARERGIPVVVDPKYRNFFSYAGATVFKPNRRELESALGAAVDLEHPEALPATLGRLNVENLLLTLGERGMILVARDGSVFRVSTTAREVFDVVGAGDTVTAYLAAMLASGATAREAATIANFAAGVEVGKLGAATVSSDEVIAAYDDLSSNSA